eukprot:8501270-Karenia_brevis.AAC.1
MGQKVIANIQSENCQEEYKDTERAVPPEEEDLEDYEGEAWDDISGEELDPKRVREARKLEMEYYDKMR